MANPRSFNESAAEQEEAERQREADAAELLRLEPMLPLAMPDGSVLTNYTGSSFEFTVDEALLSAAITLIRLPNSDGSHLRKIEEARERMSSASANSFDSLKTSSKGGSRPSNKVDADAVAAAARLQLCRITLTATAMILSNCSNGLKVETRIPLKPASVIPPTALVSFNIQLWRLEAMFTEYQRPDGYKTEVQRRKGGYIPQKFDRYTYLRAEKTLLLERGDVAYLSLPIEPVEPNSFLANRFANGDNCLVDAQALATALGHTLPALRKTDRFGPPPVVHVATGSCAAASNSLAIKYVCPALDWPSFDCPKELARPLSIALRRSRTDCKARLEQGALLFGNDSLVCRAEVKAAGKSLADELFDLDARDATSWSMFTHDFQYSMQGIGSQANGECELHIRPTDAFEELLNPTEQDWWYSPLWERKVAKLANFKGAFLFLGAAHDIHTRTLSSAGRPIQELKSSGDGGRTLTVNLKDLLGIAKKLRSNVLKMAITRVGALLIRDEGEEFSCTYLIPSYRKPEGKNREAG